MLIYAQLIRSLGACLLFMLFGFYVGLNYDHAAVKHRIPVRVATYLGIDQKLLRNPIQAVGVKYASDTTFEKEASTKNTGGIDWQSRCSDYVSKLEKNLTNAMHPIHHSAQLNGQIHKAQKLLLTAHRYARSSTSILTISKAFHELEQMMHFIQDGSNTSFTNENFSTNQYLFPHVKDISKGQQFDVCPENWMGMKYGYPFYYTGHVTEKCSWGKAVSELLTIILDFSNTDVNTVKNVVSQIHSVHPEVELLLFHIAASDVAELNNLSFTKTVPSKRGRSTVGAKDLNSVIAGVKTKYILIAQNLQYFTNDSQLVRLIRMIDYVNVDVAGGAHRNLSGHWKIDCYQAKMRNFDFRIVEGYDLSYNSCIYCDYTGGPFMAKTDFLRNHSFSDSLTGELMYLDWFYRLAKAEKRIMNCPDALFYTKSISKLTELSKSQWLPFVKKWQLNFITLPPPTSLSAPVRLQFSCTDLGHKCTWPAKGMTNMPCCLKRLSDMLKFFLAQSARANVGTEVEAGTNVGAVKFSATLPWELDADLNYVSGGGNQQKLRKLIPTFKKQGYALQETGKIDKCKNNTCLNCSVNCGYFALRASGWRIECWGSHYLAGKVLDDLKQNSTKVLIDGDWLRAYPNPAYFARNLYGDDIFKHVEHWIHLGYKTGWIPYTAGSFLKCPKPGSHACLDQYLAVGNIQFQQVWL